jgi:hypothetical protein
MKTNLSKCFISISTIGVAVAQSRRGQHPQIIPVAHRPANAGMMNQLNKRERLSETEAAFLSKNLDTVRKWAYSENSWKIQNSKYRRISTE